MTWMKVGTKMAAVAAIVLAGLVAAVPVLAVQRTALVIGNSAYDHVPTLANPRNDAADVGAALARLGFAVTRRDNTGHAELRQGLLDFQRAASASETAVVFYADHGIEVDGRNFLVPVDARLASDQDVEFEAVPLELVSRAVSMQRAGGDTFDRSGSYTGGAIGGDAGGVCGEGGDGSGRRRGSEQPVQYGVAPALGGAGP